MHHLCIQLETTHINLGDYTSLLCSTSPSIYLFLGVVASLVCLRSGTNMTNIALDSSLRDLTSCKPQSKQRELNPLLHPWITKTRVTISASHVPKRYIVFGCPHHQVCIVGWSDHLSPLTNLIKPKIWSHYNASTFSPSMSWIVWAYHMASRQKQHITMWIAILGVN